MVAGLNSDTILEKTPCYAQSLKKDHAAVYGHDYWQELLSVATRFIKTMPEQGPTIKQAIEVDFPILVSLGDSDQLITLDEAIRLFRALRKGELLVLPATRHPFQRVRLDSFLPVLLDFLKRANKTETEGISST